MNTRTLAAVRTTASPAASPTTGTQTLGRSHSRFAALALALLMSLGTLSSLHGLAASGVPADNLARASSALNQA
jgi:hypothetical protein